MIGRFWNGIFPIGTAQDVINPGLRLQEVVKRLIKQTCGASSGILVRPTKHNKTQNLGMYQFYEDKCIESGAPIVS